LIFGTATSKERAFGDKSVIDKAIFNRLKNKKKSSKKKAAAAVVLSTSSNSITEENNAEENELTRVPSEINIGGGEANDDDDDDDNMEINEDDEDDPLLQMMLFPRSTGAILCMKWMGETFDLLGDHCPKSNEIHLEKCERLEIYNMYKASFYEKLEDREIVSYSYFVKIWRTNYSHVKIREYKAVTGKCHFCAILTECRAKSHRADVSSSTNYRYACTSSFHIHV
jgi:hypothetical protein